MSFYVTLPSDGSRDTFPNNKTHEFTIQLPERLILEEPDWEVALASISLPYSQVYLDLDLDTKGNNAKGRIIRDSQLWWRLISKDNHGKRDEPQLQLRRDCSWIWCGIEDHFRQLFGSPTPTLYVHTDVGQSQIVGTTTTDLLRAFTYTHQGEGHDYFEPRRLHFVPIRKNVIDTISVKIRDPGGQDVSFVGGPVMVTLKFERRSARV